MKLPSSIKALGLALALALSTTAPGCSDDNTNVVVATSREIRGIVPVRTGALRVLRIVAINARTRRVVAQTEPAADGSFVLRGVTKGAPYKVNAVVGRRTVPITFPKSRGSTDKTNVFEIGTDDSPAAPLDGPIDLGRLSDATESFETPPDHAPNLFEDYDRDGVVDGDDPDVDGDGTPNVTDRDSDNDGTPDSVAVGDLDGDGLTNDADNDVDGDGTPNATDTDNDNDGTPDATDASPDGDTGNPAGDFDGDGLPDSEDDTPHGADSMGSSDLDASAPTDAEVPEDAAIGDGGTKDAGAPDDAEAPIDG